MKFAVIGTSWITDSFITSGNYIDGFELYAVYSRSIEKGRDFAEKHGAKLYFDSIDEMLSHSEIDAVYVASPNVCHFGQSLKCLEAGKNVICEKPAVVYPYQLEILHKTAEENGVVFFEAIKSLHSEGLPLLRKAVSECGIIKTAILDFSQLSSKYFSLKNGELPNIFNPELCTGGLMDLGVYNIYVAVELFGVPEKVESHIDFLHTGADHSGTVLFIYKDKTVTLLYSKVAQSYAPSQILGDKGTVTVKSLSKLIGIKKYTKDGEETVYPERDENLIMSMEIRDFMNYVINGKNKSYYDDCKISLDVCRLIETVRKQSGFKF